MSYIVTIAAGASASAPSAAVLEATRRILRRNGVRSDAIVLRNLPSTDLLRGRPDRPVLEAVQCLIERAEGIVIATPIQEVVYSSLLKTFLATLRPNVLQDRAVLLVATGGAVTRPLSQDDRLKPFPASLRVGSVLPPLFIADSQIQFEHGGLVRLEEDAEARLRDSLDELTRSMRPVAPGVMESTEPRNTMLSTYIGR